MARTILQYNYLTETNELEIIELDMPTIDDSRYNINRAAANQLKAIKAIYTTSINALLAWLANNDITHKDYINNSNTANALRIKIKAVDNRLRPRKIISDVIEISVPNYVNL